MAPNKLLTTRNISILFLLVFIMLLLFVLLTQPFLIHRVITKIFTGYEIYLLKYPRSSLVETEIRPTSKVSMATYYSFITPDDIETVLVFMEQKLPGFELMKGSYVIQEPTFQNDVCAQVTPFKNVFQKLSKGFPCIEINIFPSTDEGTEIIISEHWYSMFFPRWLTEW